MLPIIRGISEHPSSLPFSTLIMENSAPLFKNILGTNHLIKGRLNIKQSDLEKLYRILLKDDDRLRKKQARQEKMIKTQITKRNMIRFQQKRNSESLNKSFYPTTNKVSLLYKRQVGIYYIKARFYWEGKQREVQVGSIPNVIEIINIMISNKLLPDLKHVRAKKLTWNQINKRIELIEAIKVIASLKAQEYILRRLMKNKFSGIVEMDDNIHEKNAIPIEIQEIPHTDADNDVPYEEDHEEKEGVEWYERWRRDNL